MSLRIHKEQVDNRRLYSRGTTRAVTLVFFGPGKWGKLIDISEGGMAFEFHQLPPTDQRLSFGLEAMGREPSEPSGKLATDSIHADGQVVWTRDFERCAGVQFVEISRAARQQIRRWLSIEAPAEAAADGDEVQPNSIETELSGPTLTLHVTTGKGTDEGQPLNVELGQRSSPQVLWGPDFNEQPTLEKPAGAKFQTDRLALMRMARWVTILVLLGATTTMILSQRVHLAALFASNREGSISNRLPPRTEEPSVAKTPAAFQVEAVDMNNRRTLLTFGNDTTAAEAWLSSAASRTPNKAFLLKAAAPPAERTAAAKRQSLSNLKLGGAKVTRLATNASREDSKLAIDSVAPSGEAMREGQGAILAHTATAAPQPILVGGQLQQARLISSVTPAYPALARLRGLQGEVIIDALIDSTGRVTVMKLLSGPPLLQQAAMDALRQWKYEPARLDGQPVSTHLSVTIKFHFD